MINFYYIAEPWKKNYWKTVAGRYDKGFRDDIGSIYQMRLCELQNRIPCLINPPQPVNLKIQHVVCHQKLLF